MSIYCTDQFDQMGNKYDNKYGSDHFLGAQERHQCIGTANQIQEKESAEN